MTGIKTGDNGQWGLASELGTRLDAGLASVPNGDGIPPLVDNDGRLWTRDAGSPVPSFGDVQFYDPAALAAAHVVSAFPATVLRIYGFKTGAGTEYVQLLNLAAAPGGGETPVASIPITQNGTFSLGFPYGRILGVGIVVALSSTPAVFAAGTASLWANAEWLQ